MIHEKYKSVIYLFLKYITIPNFFIKKIKNTLFHLKTPLFLHIGCSNRRVKNWVNVDLNPLARKDLWLDVRNGLPYPDNMTTAQSMEAAVRESGATPATIAIIQGQLVVGLMPDQLEYLATRPMASVRKCSRRDLALAVAGREDGATTVAGTMIVAHLAGIELFATGGIGGVHRGHPFDVSADLTELGRTPVTVVSSGAKSILDLHLTREVLETNGVPVIGFG